MNKKKRVGILIDSENVSNQTYNFLKLSLESKNYEVTTLIVNKLKKNDSNVILKMGSYINRLGLSKFISLATFKIICKIESLILNCFDKTSNFYHMHHLGKTSNFYDMHKLREEDYELINVNPIVSESGFVYRYTKEDIEKIKNAKLNLIIRAGSGILSGEILTVCPNGIISFHHADNEINRGGPPAFWEVYERNPRTGFIIQRLNEELDGGDVLYKGFIVTSWIYSLNLFKLYEVANPFLNIVIDDLTSDKSSLSLHHKYPYSYSLYTTPTLIQSIIYIVKTLSFLFKKVTRKIIRKNSRWGIAYQFVDNWKDITLWRSKKIPNPKNRYLADPFIIYQNGEHYCFVEDYDYSIGRGCISVYKITPNSYEELGVALLEDFHLSFPFLFKFNDELYMCPETREKNEIRIYKCEEFPLKWSFHKTVMKNIAAVDTLILPYEKKWWLFTNIDMSSFGDMSSQLQIFHGSDPFTDNWIPHEKNPVVFDPLKARNGGLIIDNAGIYRAYQRQGFDIYGEAVGLAKINALTMSEYSEEVLFEIEPEFFKGIEGCHTYNFIHGLAVFDFVKIEK